MSGQGTFAISDEKRQRLRNRGIVASSKGFLVGAAMLGLSLFAVFFVKFGAVSFALFAEKYFASQATAISEVPLLFSKDAIATFVELVFLPLLIIPVIIIFAGLVQSKFLFKVNLLFENYEPQRAVGGRSSRSLSTVELFSGFLKLASVCALVFMISEQMFDDLVVAFLTDLRSQIILGEDSNLVAPLLIKESVIAFYRIIAILTAFTLLIGIGSLLFARMRFEKQHLMTRAEIEAEDREQGGAVHSGNYLENKDLTEQDGGE